MFSKPQAIRYSINGMRLGSRISRSFYDSYSKNDTIFAPATQIQSAKGAPLGVIRISGERAKEVVELITRYKVVENDQISNSTQAISPRKVKLVKFWNPTTKDIIDQGLVLWFNAPHSYTGEDVCEFHLHGSRSVIGSILRVLGQIENLRSAEPGEFTRRAYLNGKLSLIQAESLKDLIESNTDHQRKLALSGLSGSTTEKYEVWSDILVKTLAHLEATIDFGEDSSLNESQMTTNSLQQIQQLIRDMTSFIDISSRRREAVRGGFKVVILGDPNSGKSTLMNLLCGHDKSIVSSLSGTTRDVVEHSFELEGHLLRLSDTAGLKEIESSKSSSVEKSQQDQLLSQHEMVEKEGIKRALNEARNSDMILFMVDGSNIKDMNMETGKIVAHIKRLLQISGIDWSIPLKLIVNKIDCNTQLDLVNSLETLTSHPNLAELNIQPFMISCRTQENVNSLIQGLTEHLNKISLLDERDTSRESLHYVNERHLSLLGHALTHLQKATELDPFTDLDRIAQHLRESAGYLSSITGMISNQRVIDVIFKDFCIGK